MHFLRWDKSSGVYSIRKGKGDRTSASPLPPFFWSSFVKTISEKPPKKTLIFYVSAPLLTEM